MIRKVIEIAEKAGQILMKHRGNNLEIKTKADRFDFVTQADLESDSFIRAELSKLFPNDYILSEESDDIPKDFSGNVWMVDPLDGTKDFVNGGGGFSVMVGLCQDGIPVLGVVYAPAKNKLYYAEKNKGAYLKIEDISKKISVSSISNLSQSRVVTRHIHGEQRDSDMMIKAIPKLREIPESSVGVKLGLISEGLADIQVHTNTRGSKWDTCAPQIILEEAGGKLTNHRGEELSYKQRSLVWLDSFVASNTYLHDKIVDYLKNNTL